MSNNSYRLIKGYPMSHKIGTIIPKGGMGWGGLYPELENGLYSEFWEKIKEPLFITEDGVEINVRDNFYYIGDSFNICLTRCLYEGDGDFRKFKTFSTEEAAREWVELNKPKYSLQDIINAKVLVGDAARCTTMHIDLIKLKK